MTRRGTPELVPLLSRGKHRNPRRGACFMEYVSYLAGERWSDHPDCTHPLLAAVARGVNDQISDSGRTRLVHLIPSVVGLNGADPMVDVGISIRCAATALPVASADRQRALAAGLLTARRLLAEFDGHDTKELTDHADQALERTPSAARWADDFVTGVTVTPKAFRSRSAPTMVRVSITGIAEACISDRDELLHELLETVVDDCTRWLDPHTEADLTGLQGLLEESRHQALRA